MGAHDPKNDPVHFPEDRRLRIWVRRRFLLIFLILILVPIILAWCQYLLVGLPTNPIAPRQLDFPLWLRATHFLNIIFMILLIRSGLSILMDHPRLYWNDHCTPGTEWFRATPLEVPTDRVWTAKDDARYISPWLALPGYRHTIGMARHWHFIVVLFWSLNGITYVSLMLITGEWQRIIPTSWQIFPGVWAMFVSYVTLHFPPEILGTYNPLQQLTYFTVIFIFAPLSFFTGMAMSPGVLSRFPWYAKIFGGRQSARSIHFLLFLGYICFIVGHVILVASTGLTGNMNRMVLGSDGDSYLGVVVGLLGIGVVVAVCVFAHYIAWHYPRIPQNLAKFIHLSIMRRLFFSHLKLSPTGYSKKDISPRFWANGKLPTSEEWKKLESGNFKDYRLKIYGLVDNPVELSLEELRSIGKQDQVTLHNCIQGWSGIAHWGGIPLSKLIPLVKPKAEARSVIFHSFGEGLYGGEYYDSQSLKDIMHPHCILAYDMNYEPLPTLYGAPLRLRVENQLGYKMVKWIKSIEFVKSVKDVGKGYGGKNEDDEYFDIVPEI